MRNIENTYVSYEDLVERVGEEIIQSRIAQVNQELYEFLKENELQDIAYVHQIALTHAILDYFSDIERLKQYQKIEHVNEIKIKAYETYWILKRKPIQLKCDLEDDTYLYVNEKFLLARLASFLLQDNINVPMVQERRDAFKNFLDTLYYYLKFRKCDAQALELMMLAFEAGKLLVFER